MIRLTLDGIFPNGLKRRTDLAKARIFLAVFESAGTRTVTRGTLVQELSLRPATVSAMVGELIDDGLIVESKASRLPRKGRPEVPLTPNPHRAVTPVIDVVSREIHGTLLTMDGRAVAGSTAILDVEQTDQDALSNAFMSVAESIISRKPPGAAVPGIGITLPGIVDERRRRWLSVARWPRVEGLDFRHLEEQTGLPVRVERKRQAVLRAHFHSHPEDRHGGVLLVNWGYGISSAYAHNGEVLSSTVGGFGDIGHWLVTPGGRACLCGQHGCLEAYAALWALLPEIIRDFQDTPSEPDALSSYLRKLDLSQIPRLIEAIELFTVAMHNLFKAFFPDRILLAGNVVENEWVWREVQRRFYELAPAYARDRVALERINPRSDAALGMATPFFHEVLRPLLLARNLRV